MIKFFRQLRQQLLMENKTSKYFKYAIGEIVLVVIGILIALQINNWNENRQAKRSAEIYIKDIKQDLVKDTIMLNSALKRLKQTLANNKAILSIKRDNKLSQDSIATVLSVFHSTRIYQINNSTFLKLLNTGFLESRAYHQLFSNINTYYTDEYVTYSEYIEWDEEQSIDVFHNDFLDTYKNQIDITSLFREYSDHFSLKELEMELQTFRGFVSSKHFRNKVLANYRRKKRVEERMEIQKQLATDLIDKINTSL